MHVISRYLQIIKLYTLATGLFSLVIVLIIIFPKLGTADTREGHFHGGRHFGEWIVTS